MGFTLLIVPHGPPGNQTLTYHGEDWPQRLKELIPDIEVHLCHSAEEASELIENADAAFGDVGPDLFSRAKRLRWIACPAAGPYAGYYHEALIESDVVVTNSRGIFGDHISAHVMAFVLAHARGLHQYLSQQHEHVWRPGYRPVHLPEATALIVGLGGIGADTARLCAAFGMTVIAADARRTDAPSGVAELHRAEALPQLLPRADFVIVTVPETPVTQGMFGAEQFHAMKPTAFFVNIGGVRRWSWTTWQRR